MSWLYSQALVEEYLGENFLDGEQSALLSGSNTQQAYCAPGKMMGFSRLSRFGMTYKHLAESRGEELLTLYLAGFHAKTLAQQEKAQESTVSAQECGEKWHASFTKYDPDLRLWKTHQCSLLGDLEPFSQTWPQWGLMRDGECWEQRTLEQTTRGTESGLLPNGVDSFHTPNTTGLDGGSNSRKALKKRQEKWPTPNASDNRDRGNMSNPSIQRRIAIGKQVGLSVAVKPDSTVTGTLNPMWVEWLMGWPLGWTDLRRLEMDKSHYVPQQPGKF
jgi:DNA (cytosine-5)-methyltransferase 1